ncbi:MAG: M20/M25/M40 family metallo-hydrolase, partial [Rhodothermales bacterium]|nr:M20/M25/M40 family metallo-hydrolase [Rhodothermales bacterium]
GRSAHAARAHLGENAVEKAARDIARLANARLEREHPLLGPTMLTVTTVEGGKATNVVPDRCSFSIDVRSTPEYTHDELVEYVQKLIESRVEVYSDRLVPVSTDPQERIVQACVKATRAQPFGSPTMSDWIFLRDLPTVKIGPGSSELSHTSEEHIHVDEVHRAARVYKEIIQHYYSTPRAAG